VEWVDRLAEAIRDKGRLIVLFSGGLDSTVLASVAKRELGGQALALTFASPVMPASELDAACKTAGSIGIAHVLLPMDELEEAAFAANPPERCYICRKMRNGRALAWARENGFPVVSDGSNASDLGDYRPGMIASQEDGIWQPFVELGITKADIRALAQRDGIGPWDRPPSACLCTRFPAGFPLTRELLRRVEAAEAKLVQLGFGDVRVRCFPYDTALIQVAETERLVSMRDEVARFMRGLGFLFVSLDLEGFSSGSLNRIVTGRQAFVMPPAAPKR